MRAPSFDEDPIMLAKCHRLPASPWTGVFVVSLTFVTLALVWRHSDAGPREPESDVVCEALLRDYVLNTGKIESRSVNAATQLLGVRGRGKDYWKVVLRHFKESDAKGRTAVQSSRLLTVLTIMLEYDGRARWLLSRPEELRQSAWVPQITLSEEVLDTIIERASTVDRNHLDAHLVAVVVAHDHRAKPFLKSILEGKDERIDQGTRFHAAVGLAELGDGAGFRWLVEANPMGEIWSAPHLDAPNGSCLESRVQALNDLTGLKKKTIEEWQAWWKAQRDPISAAGRVRLRYP